MKDDSTRRQRNERTSTKNLCNNKKYLTVEFMVTEINKIINESFLDIYDIRLEQIRFRHPCSILITINCTYRFRSRVFLLSS